MKKIGILFFIFINLFLLNSCGGGGAGSSSNPKGNAPGEPHTLLLFSEKNMAQTGSYVNVRAKLMDGNGNPIKGEVINFTKESIIGTINPASEVSTESQVTTAITDEKGIATVKVRSTTPGYVIVVAESKGLRDKRAIYFATEDSFRGVGFTPIQVYVGVDGNDNGIYNEASDLNICENIGDDKLKIKVIVYKEGARFPGVWVTVSSDAKDIIKFPKSQISDTVITDNNGEAFTEISFDCLIEGFERIINIFAETEQVYVPDFDGYFIGVGGVPLFSQPVYITSIDVEAIPSIVKTGGTATIRATVNTTAGSSTVPDGTVVNFRATCGTVDPTAQTKEGIAEAKFTAPSSAPPDYTCKVIAWIGDKSGSVDISVIPNISLQVTPSETCVKKSEGGTVTFTIIGGLPPYRIYTSDQGLPPSPDIVNMFGGTFSVTVPAMPDSEDKTITYTIIDSEGNKAEAKINIKEACEQVSQLTVDPLTADICENDDSCDANTEIATFKISGGKRPYKVTSTNTNVIPQNNIKFVNENVFTVDAKDDSITSDTKVDLIVQDSATPINSVIVKVNVKNQ